MSRIYTRREWGARYRDGVGSRTVGSLQKYLHHSVTTHLSETATVAEEMAQMRIIERIGQQRFGAGISYTFIIFPSGRVYEGASVGRISYHSGGGNDGKPRNTMGAGICLAGNYQTRKLGTKARNGIVWLLQHGVRKGWWGDPALTEGHRDFKATACPGQHAYSEIGEINRLGRGSSVAKPSPAPAPSRPKIKIAKPMALPKKAPSNLTIQKRLKKMGFYKGWLDGKNGAYQKAAVRAYYRSQGYIPGVADDAVWGRYMEGHYKWTLRLQRAMHKWKGSIRSSRDGNYGGWTTRRVMEIMRRNHGGAYRGALDNIPGPVFCGMLNIPAHPGLN